jgi:hypothetical protein
LLDPQKSDYSFRRCWPEAIDGARAAIRFPTAKEYLGDVAQLDKALSIMRGIEIRRVNENNTYPMNISAEDRKTYREQLYFAMKNLEWWRDEFKRRAVANGNGAQASKDEPQEKMGYRTPVSTLGVSMLDVALLFENDKDMAKAIVDRWQRTRTPKPPESIGFDPAHAQIKLYAPAAILKYAENIEGRLPKSQAACLSELKAKARQPRPKK